MAAYAALLSLKFILNQIQQHHSPPISLDQQQLCSLTQNLSFLQNFLEAYSEEDDELESRICDAAYAAEDVIESHIVDQIHARSTSTHGENISSTDLYEGVERVIQDMDLIKKEVITIKEKMGAQHHQLMSMNSSVSIGSARPVSRMQNSTMVDFGDILVAVMDKLTRQDSNLEIVPIVGMGGMGKTTLARIIYEHPLIVQHFDFLVWVTISKEYSVREILLRVLSEQNNKGEKSEDHELGERVYKRLYGRRYLIVMDDIWSIEAWDKVKTYFPNDSEGSKIMITTRNSNLAFQSSGSHDFQMKFLDDVKSWDLLCNVVFGKECCPIELEHIGKEIAKNCRGLPLAIVVIGGLLTKSNKTREYWQYTLENLISQINLENNEHCLQILRRSYKELPIHLKPCFLYIGVFPEDRKIRVGDLIKLWVAEGFLKPSENKSLEEVAEEYAKELSERNLINLVVHERPWSVEDKSYKIHDLLRDVCLREARKQRFFCVLRREDVNNIPKDVNMERRICIHDNTEEEFPPQLIHAVESAPLIRSLISFSDDDSIISPSSLTCRLLRVLAYFSYNYSRYRRSADLEAMFQHANLRYLSLKIHRESYRFPISWHLLWNFQTLDVFIIYLESGIAIPPSEFWKMCHLRHVKFFRIQLLDPPCGEDEFVLENLHTLSFVDNFKCSEEMVKRIPNIKILELFYYEYTVEEEGLHSFSLNNLCRLRNLESLYLYLKYYGEGMQNQLSLPDSLKKLSLCGTGFLWEDLNTKIGSLPLLQYLYLEYKSCVGPEWETIEGQFHSLKVLTIKSCDLKCWKTDGTHFPRLERLNLWALKELEEIPLSIGDIPTLQSIKVDHCSKSVVASAEKIKEEQLSYGNEDLQVLIGMNSSTVYISFLNHSLFSFRRINVVNITTS